MTSPKPSALTSETALTLAQWAGLATTVETALELAAIFEAFHERVQRLYAIDVESVEFDFLQPMD
jgi:Asp-tRNA(Asn)/Glu-tRNA(Gln) amidotransferase C subunit